MKASEIKVGGLYEAKISDRVVTVRVDAIRKRGTASRVGREVTVYDVTNLTTGRKTTFRSAAKFRGVVKATIVAKAKSVVVPAATTPPGRVVLSGYNRELGSIGLATDTAPHLIVEARAGTGKTTTLIAALQLLKGQTPTAANGKPIEPSPQQRAVWDSVLLSREHARTVNFVAFNRSIAAELRSRVPRGVDAMTMHGFGYRAVTKAFKLYGGERGIDKDRVERITAGLLGTDKWEARRTKPVLLRAVAELVGLCKMNLVNPSVRGSDVAALGEPLHLLWGEKLDALARHYEVEMDGVFREEVYGLVPRVLKACTRVADDGCIDFDDMIWLPVVLGLPVTRYDLLMVDEAQDLNRCQQALAKIAGDRLVLVGDPKQAIYGFAGADAESMPRMTAELRATDRGCDTLPLTVTRRCGRAIVKEANKIVPDFEAHESNGEGSVCRAHMSNDPHAGTKTFHYTQLARDGDMVVCRVNAPLVSECFRFIKAGRKATIIGRDVARNLVKTTESLKAKDVADLITKLGEWLERETTKEQAKKNPSESRIVGLQDRHDCLMCFTEGLDPRDPVAAVTAKVNQVFAAKKCPKCNKSFDDTSARVCDDDRCNAEPLVLPGGIRLSSIHKAKGLEADRVFLLEPEGATVPHPMAKSAWQVEQEWNLRYVAITRAIRELVYVS